MDNMIKKYINIIKNKRCSRKDFWTFYLFMWIVFFLIYLIQFIFMNYYDYGFNIDFYNNFSLFIIIFLGIVCILLQIYRLKDIGLTPLLLFLYLLGFIHKSFTFVVSILIIVLLCLPSQKIPTTQIDYRRNNDENK